MQVVEAVVQKKRGRKPGSKDTKPRQVRNSKRKPVPHVSMNGIHAEASVMFDLTETEMEKLYPDHSLTEVYKAIKVYPGYEVSSNECEVTIRRLDGELMGFVMAKHLKLVTEGGA